MAAIVDPKVKEAFSRFTPDVRKKLQALRKIIFEVAARTQGVGELEETLKWGQPSYLTTQTKSGSTIRIGREKKTAGDYAVFFKCRTTLVSSFREIYNKEFRYEGNRAIVFRLEDEIPVNELSRCIQMALTYNLNKKKEKAL